MPVTKPGPAVTREGTDPTASSCVESTMHRHLATALLSLLFVALTAVAWAGTGDAQRPDRPEREGPSRRYAPRGPVPGFVAHEWGVFVLEHGRVAHLDELAAELPPFVHRGGGPLAGRPVPPVHPVRPGGVLARKPVLFFHADAPLDVRVEVGFAGGEPWLHFPAGQRVPEGLAAGAPGLVWDLRVEPGTRAGLAAAPPGHFWGDLRAVGGDPVRGADGSWERFLFYDGPVAFERSFLIGRHGTGAAVTPTSSERTLFLVERGLYSESDIDPRTWSSSQRSTGTMVALRIRLEAELMRRGLTRAEAVSLLDTWRDDLFSDPRPRALYFVPRDAYDRMLPIRLTPAPSELVRVGLVIDRLDP